jgi:hypothetical protein
LNNQVQAPSLKSEWDREFQEFRKALLEQASGGFAAGFLLFAYSKSNFPGSPRAHVLFEKVVNEVVRPDAGFFLASIVSCCLALAAAAPWIRKALAGPFLKFCFDLSGTALGAIVPAVVAVSTQKDYLKATGVFIMAFFAFGGSALLLWTARYFLSEQFHKIVGASSNNFLQWFVPFGAAFVLLFLYITYQG